MSDKRHASRKQSCVRMQTHRKPEQERGEQCGALGMQTSATRQHRWWKADRREGLRGRSLGNGRDATDRATHAADTHNDERCARRLQRRRARRSQRWVSRAYPQQDSRRPSHGRKSRRGASFSSRSSRHCYGGQRRSEPSAAETGQRVQRVCEDGSVFGSTGDALHRQTSNTRWTLVFAMTGRRGRRPRFIGVAR